MRILVIGSGGREHALVWKLAQSAKVSKIYAAPGNPGIAELAECVQLDLTNLSAVADFAQQQAVDLTVVGPEATLVAGIVDVFQARGLNIFGPSKLAAQIEGSKGFAKDLMAKYNIPTAAFGVFYDADSAKKYIREQGAPIVVKADGLAAGKGVIVAMTEAEALEAIDKIMLDSEFGQAGASVVIEEYLAGEEASLLAFTDGKTIVPMVAAQDHKRIFDADQGPNTGGMGTYAPAPVLTPELQQLCLDTVLVPTIKAMAAEGCPYVGCLYAGLMITKQGIKVIEFNARFGDPETQVIMPLLASDLAEVLLACAQGRLQDVEVKWNNQAAVCVVMAAQGYPASDYRKNEPISGLESVKQLENATVFHAGTGIRAEQLVTTGGRVLGVVGCAQDLRAAKDLAYQAVEKINFTGQHYRKDIAWRALK